MDFRSLVCLFRVFLDWHVQNGDETFVNVVTINDAVVSHYPVFRHLLGAVWVET